MTTNLIKETEFKGIKLGASLKAAWSLEEIHTGHAEKSTEKAIKFTRMDWIPFSMIHSIIWRDNDGVKTIDSVVIPAWLARKI